MEFPDGWNKEMIEFYLNDSSWCCSNLIDLLEKYDEEHGCICSICKALVKEADVIGDITNGLNQKRFVIAKKPQDDVC